MQAIATAQQVGRGGGTAPTIYFDLAAPATPT
jgi:hypothetical protein